MLFICTNNHLYLTILKNTSWRCGTRKEPEIPEWLETLLLRQKQVLNRQEEIRAENEATREATHREEIQLLRNMIASQNNSSSTSSTNQTTQNNSESGHTGKTNAVPRPPLLLEDTSYSKFLAWRETWQDYYMLVNLDKLPLE